MTLHAKIELRAHPVMWGFFSSARKNPISKKLQAAFFSISTVIWNLIHFISRRISSGL